MTSIRDGKGNDAMERLHAFFKVHNNELTSSGDHFIFSSSLLGVGMEISLLLALGCLQTQVAEVKKKIPAQPLSYTQSSHREGKKTATRPAKILPVDEGNPLSDRFIRLRHSAEA